MTPAGPAAEANGPRRWPPTTESAFERLNTDFYGTDPDDYFHTRWLALMLLAGRPEAALGLLEDGIAVGNIVARLESPEIDPDGVRDYVTLESQVLLHQTIETLLRLFFAHAGWPPCPWLEVASETNFRTFKDRVQREIIEADVRQTVDDLFLCGQAGHVATDDQAATRLEKGLDSLVLFLRGFAKRWLADAHAYNSLKHGLSVTPGAVQVSFAPDEPTDGAEAPQGVLLGHGPSLDFLECTPWVDGKRSWMRTTIWIDATEALAHIEIARQMIASLWAVARFRYLQSGPPAQLFCPDGLTLHQFRSPGRSPGIRASFPTGLDETK